MPLPGLSVLQGPCWNPLTLFSVFARNFLKIASLSYDGASPILETESLLSSPQSGETVASLKISVLATDLTCLVWTRSTVGCSPRLEQNTLVT